MLIVIEASPLTTIQDLGRAGWARYGVPRCGAMDEFALRAANRLVGNSDGAAGLEVGLGDLSLEATEDCVIAATGMGYDLFVGGRRLPLWMCVRVRRGQTVELRKCRGGCWAYLGVSGGIECPVVLGARATYTRGNFGGLEGRSLRGGDTLPIGVPSISLSVLAGREIAEASRPVYSSLATVEVILGPQQDYFASEIVDIFVSSEYQILATSDRMGYRLEALRPELPRQGALGPATSADIVSDGMVMGSVQVPANGQPIVMMADGPTTGGYPKIATVISADLPLVAQCAPGEGRLWFRATTIEAAQTKYRAMMDGLRVSEDLTPFPLS